VRISGRQVPPGYLRWVAAGLGTLLLSVAVAVIVSLAGLFGATVPTADTGTSVAAKVATGAPCNQPNAVETVTFRYQGDDRKARFDGCGHAKGEPVEIILPPGPLAETTVVQAAGTAVGGGVAGEGLASVLLVTSGVAGAAYAFLVRRGPKEKSLPRPLRLVA
jgi:hypothetical protein